MTPIVFEGGPNHGKVQAVSQLPQAIQAAYMRPMPIWVPPPPRPKWWRHPIQWFRWKPPPPPPMPVMEQLTYRRTSEVRDGARVYEITGEWGYKGPEADGDGEPVKATLKALSGVHPIIRRDPLTRWVMGPSWWYQLRTAAVAINGYSDDWRPSPEDIMFGIPVEVREDGGAPHLENRRYPQDYP